MMASSAVDKNERPLCYCFDVAETDVRQYFERADATVEGLIADTKIGTKCTACLLDLDVVLESCHRSLTGTADDRVERSASSAESDGSIRQAADFTNSIFYVCDGVVNTVIRVANQGFLFENTDTVVEHSYSLFVFSNDGKLTAGRRGTVDAFGDLEVDLSTIPGISPQGWVMLSMYPKRPGFRGSNRPYVTFNGPGWTASVHMQRHALASRRNIRNVNFLTREANGRLDAYLSIFNGALNPTDVRVDLVDAYGSYRERRTLNLPRYGAEFVALDDLFSPTPGADVLTIRVYSDEPTRKMLVNVHGDRSWSVDHFPDFPNDL
jgi:hypothetical protein